MDGEGGVFEVKKVVVVLGGSLGVIVIAAFYLSWTFDFDGMAVHGNRPLCLRHRQMHCVLLSDCLKTVGTEKRGTGSLGRINV